jgi:hypothetical protein
MSSQYHEIRFLPRQLLPDQEQRIAVFGRHDRPAFAEAQILDERGQRLPGRRPEPV